MTTKRKEGQVPDYLVERLAAGDLPGGRAAEVRGRLALEPAGAERLEALTASNDVILGQHPPSLIGAEVRRRAAARDRGVAAATHPSRGLPRWGLAIGAPGALVTALALALWLRPPANDVRVGGVDETATAAGGGVSEGPDRIKGLRPTLRVYRKTAGKVERLKEGAPTRAGDELQVAYVAAGHKYGVVLSVDGAGHVTYHLPPTGGPAARLRTDGEVALPEAYELDAAPGFERFVLVVGDAPFDASAALNEVIRGEGKTPAGTVAASFTVRKE